MEFVHRNATKCFVEGQRISASMNLSKRNDNIRNEICTTFPVNDGNNQTKMKSNEM